jgi:hypothetical protein
MEDITGRRRAARAPTMNGRDATGARRGGNPPAATVDAREAVAETTRPDARAFAAAVASLTADATPTTPRPTPTTPWAMPTVVEAEAIETEDEEDASAPAPAPSGAEASSYDEEDA